jgi:hypothetical protein
MGREAWMVALDASIIPPRASTSHDAEYVVTTRK